MKGDKIALHYEKYLSRILIYMGLTKNILMTIIYKITLDVLLRLGLTHTKMHSEITI